MKFHKFFLCSTLLVISLITSCGNDHNTPSPLTGEAGAIKIRPSSSGLPWKDSYGLALDALLSDSHFTFLFETEIAQEDLFLTGCLNFNSLDYQSKKIFYIAFLAAIAEAESDFEVAQRTYNRADRTMNVGMLQIDPASANRHGSRYFDRTFNEDDLKKPELNLMIGALILNNQITGRVATKRLFPERTYYWQVLSGSKRRVLKNLQMNLAPTGICGAP